MKFMQISTLLFTFTFLFHALFAAELFGASTDSSTPPRPNIVIIAVDDMGFSDIGCYGGEIKTPNLDKLAENGIKFTQFYNTARCWSTRSALMTGYYPQQIGMDPYKQGDRLPQWSPTLPRYLNELGYRSYHSGKWHVNGAPRVVADGGFNHSYLLNDHNRNFNPQNHQVDDKPIEAVKPNSDYYTTCDITNYTLKHLDEHKREHADRPFFVYTAYTVPHFPLQALPGDIEKYADRYLVGWDKIRAERFAKQQSLGIVNVNNLSPREDTIGPPYRNNNVLEKLGNRETLFPSDWETLTSEQKRFQATKMAIHAAMVDRVDQEVGRIIARIREMGVWENTILFFLSDNGASAEIMIRGDEHNTEAAPGSAETFLCLGPGWSTASNTPYRRHKVWNHEGGISTPLIVHWAEGIKQPGSLRYDAGHVVDIVPTILDIVNANTQKTGDAPAFPGVSLLPAIVADSEKKGETIVKRDYIYFEHEGNAALRIGDWKCLYTKTGEPQGRTQAAQSKGTDNWELFDLAHGDRIEQNDLSKTHPDRLNKMVTKWRELNKSFRQQER